MPRCPTCDAALEGAQDQAESCGLHGDFVAGTRLPFVLPFGALVAIERAPTFAGRAACPLCHAAMTRRYVALAGAPLEIDQCATCAGHWFDRGELARLVQAA